MKRYSIYLFLICLTLFIFGCASSKHIKRTNTPETESVTAEGVAPIISGNISDAKKSALHDALKNALGLVIGVYVSQEALVSKSVLIDDDITSQTEGYIKKYEILKEWQEREFYKIRIKAVVRKEDLAAKLKALELSSSQLGRISVSFDIADNIDGKETDAKNAETQLKEIFLEKGFMVTEGMPADVIVVGTASANAVDMPGLSGLISYRANIAITAKKYGSEEIVANGTFFAGGVDVTKDSAASVSLTNSARRAGAEFADSVMKFFKKDSIVRITISGVSNINRLNDFLKSARAINEIRDCFVRSFNGGIAIIEADLKKGVSADIARRLENKKEFGVKIIKLNPREIELEMEK